MGSPFSWGDVQNAMASVLKEQSFESLWALGWQLACAFFIGGAILTAIMTPLTYVGVKKFVEKRRNRKASKARQAAAN